MQPRAFNFHPGVFLRLVAPCYDFPILDDVCPLFKSLSCSAWFSLRRSVVTCKFLSSSSILMPRPRSTGVLGVVPYTTGGIAGEARTVIIVNRTLPR